MSKRCRAFEIEIVSAAGGDLAPEVVTHLEHCAACSALRAQTKAMIKALKKGEAPGSIEARVAFQRALSEVERPPTLWVVPLLSASASIAALILFFGLSTPAPSSENQSIFFFPSSLAGVPEARGLELPDSLSAFDDVILRPRAPGGER